MNQIMKMLYKEITYRIVILYLLFAHYALEKIILMNYSISKREQKKMLMECIYIQMEKRN